MLSLFIISGCVLIIGITLSYVIYRTLLLLLTTYPIKSKELLSNFLELIPITTPPLTDSQQETKFIIGSVKIRS